MAEEGGPSLAWRIAVLEAMASLIAARLLVAGPPLRMWKWLLGTPGGLARQGPAPTPLIWTLSRAVERAAQRLPFQTKCLPRAIALHWMLRRRNESSELVLTVLHPRQRGSIETLHAWVELHGTVVIGDMDHDFVPVARFS